MLYTLEAYDEHGSTKIWREYPQCYSSAEAALAAASRLWEDEDHFCTQIRLKRTETVCTLLRPTGDEER